MSRIYCHKAEHSLFYIALDSDGFMHSLLNYHMLEN